MHPKWVALIVAWIAVGTMVSVCAVAWGNEGRTTVAFIGTAALVWVGIATAGIAGDDSKIEKAKIERDTATNATTRNTSVDG